MRMEAQAIKEMIGAGLPDATVEVRGDDGAHFEAIIVSPSFVGKSMVAQHQMVYAALGDKMRAEIHALSMRTMTPDEYAAASN